MCRRNGEEGMKCRLILAALSAAAFFLLFFCRPCNAEYFAGQPDIEAVMRLLGADSPEDVDEFDFERLSAYIQSPLEINVATGSRLTASGLFTQHQVAAILDYRSRHGDLLSFAELAAVDGFSMEKVRVLAPFISLGSYALPGHSSAERGRISGFIGSRAGLKVSVDGISYLYGMKYRLEAYDRIHLGISADRPYSSDSGWPSRGSFHIAYYGRRHLGKIVFGDFRLRYGQGLAIWDGFRTGSLSSPESFFLRPSGITPYWSYSGEGSRRGLAADFNIGRFVISSSLSIGGLREIMQGEDRQERLSLYPVMNVAWYGRNACVSFTGYAKSGDIVRGNPEYFRSLASAGCSADFRWCAGGTDFFGEVAFDAIDLSASASAGTLFSVSEGLDLAARGMYASDRYSLAAGGRFICGERLDLKGRTGPGAYVSRHSGTFNMECTYSQEPESWSEGPGIQLKLLLNYSLQVSSSVALAARVSERLRNGDEKTRTDIRLDLKFSTGEWMSVFRMNGLYNRSPAFLSYLEGGWRPDWMSLYLRLGVFRIDSWSDRIYAYERDAPGNFNVPAYYGRGWWGALTFGLKPVRGFKVYFRFSTTQYPWKTPGVVRTPRTECRLSLAYEI